MTNYSNMLIGVNSVIPLIIRLFYTIDKIKWNVMS